jgi:uncharacterized membrane protein YozB (DUF420 family)
MTTPTLRRDVTVDLTLLAAGPTLWAMHLLAVYALVPWACRHGGSGVAVLVALTVVVIACAAGVAAAAYRRIRHGESRHVVAMTLAAGFGFAVILNGLVTVVVDPCA